MDQQIGVTIQRDVTLAFQNFSKSLLDDCGSNSEIADVPVAFRKPIYGSEKPFFRDFVAPGIILTVVFFLALALTSSALITERHEGLLDRSWVAGVYPWEILFSHVVTQFVVMFGQTVLVLIAMFYVFDLECKGDMWLVIILSMLNGLSGMCFGFVISAVCDLERNAIQLSLGSFYPTLLLSGILWPLEGMPDFLIKVAEFLPLTMATTALRSILAKNWNLTDPTVYLGFVATFAWIGIFLGTSILILKARRG